MAFHMKPQNLRLRLTFQRRRNTPRSGCRSGDVERKPVSHAGHKNSDIFSNPAVSIDPCKRFVGMHKRSCRGQRADRIDTSIPSELSGTVIFEPQPFR